MDKEKYEKEITKIKNQYFSIFKNNYDIEIPMDFNLPNDKSIWGCGELVKPENPLAKLTTDDEFCNDMYSFLKNVLAAEFCVDEYEIDLEIFQTLKKQKQLMPIEKFVKTEPKRFFKYFLEDEFKEKYLVLIEKYLIEVEKYPVNLSESINEVAYYTSKKEYKKFAEQKRIYPKKRVLTIEYNEKILEKLLSIYTNVVLEKFKSYQKDMRNYMYELNEVHKYKAMEIIKANIIN